MLFGLASQKLLTEMEPIHKINVQVHVYFAMSESKCMQRENTRRNESFGMSTKEESHGMFHVRRDFLVED